jgi:hypothetical protein
MVDARDVGAVAAEIAAAPASHAEKTYWLTGPGLVSNYEVAAVLSELLGRAVTYTELSFDENRDAMVRAGVPAPVAEMNAQAFSLTADADVEWITDDVPAVLGRPARSFRQFAAEQSRLRRRFAARRRVSPPEPRPCRVRRRSSAVAAARRLRLSSAKPGGRPGR